MEKLVRWKDNFIDVCEEYLDEVKANYYMALGAYKQKLDDAMEESFSINNHNDDQLIRTINSMLAKRSTQGTEELEGFAPDLTKLEENIFEGNDNLDEEHKVSLSILKMYLKYDMPKILDINELSKIHKTFFIDGNSSYKPGKFRKKGDVNVMIKSSQKVFVYSNNVKKYLEKFSSHLNAYTEYNPITKAAMIHGILLGIHPFKDGNGRVARFVADKMISRDLGIPLFISEAINYNSGNSTYTDALDSFHLNNDSLPLIRFFYEVTTKQLKSNIKLLNFYLKNNYNFYHKLLSAGIKESNAIKLSRLLSTRKFIRRKEVIESLGITGPTANTVLEKLSKNKIISKHKSEGRSILYKVELNDQFYLKRHLLT